MAVPSIHLQERQAGSAFRVLSEPPVEGCVHITMAGELDLTAVDRAATALDRALDEAGRVHCHLGPLRFIDLCGLQALLDATARARREGARLTVTDGPPSLTRIVSVLGLDEALDIDCGATPSGREPLRLVPPSGRGDL